MLYVLTRTSNRPVLFAGLRANLTQQAPHTHVVHSDDPSDKYVDGDVVIDGVRLPVDRRTGKCGPELYQARLLEAIRGMPPGWVVFLDDDDRFTPDALETIASLCTDPGRINAWKVRRENDRISPPEWRNPATLCWEGATFHTMHLDAAIAAIDGRFGADGRMWAALANLLPVDWHDLVIAEPQQEGKWGKGHNQRRDKPVPTLTVAVPILGRPQRIEAVTRRFDDPRIELLFLPDATDTDSIAELERLGAAYSFAHAAPDYGVPTYASKINHAYRVTTLPFLLYASDDVVPQRGWLDLALHVLRDESIGLLATNDNHHYLVRSGRLATHGIVRRAYVEMHGTASLDAGPVMSEAYRHWNCDVEISYVARQRGAFRFDRRVVLRHDHPQATRSKPDATYALGRSFADADRAIRTARIPTWPEVPT